MRGLIAPAVAVMNRLRYPQKFALITLLFALPLGVAVFFFLTEIGNDIAFSRKEVLGGEYTSSVAGILHEVQEHKALTLSILSGDAAREPERTARKAELDLRLASLEDLDLRLGPVLRTTDRWKAWKERWAALQASLATFQRPSALAAYETVQSELIALISHVGDASNLILDPDLDSYYLMSSIVGELPILAEQLDHLRALGLTTTPDKVLTIDEQGSFSASSAVLRATLAKHLRGMKTAFGINPALRGSFGPEVDRHRDGLLSIVSEIETRVLKPERFGIPPSEFVGRCGLLLRETFHLHDRLAATLARLLGRRIDRFETRRALVQALTVVMVALVLYVYWAFYVSVRQTVDTLRAVSERLVAGEKSRAVILPSRDELGEVALAFNAVATALTQANTSMQQEIAQRKQAEMTLRGSEERVRRIIDSALDAMITIDEGGIVTEWSPQAERTFGWTRSDILGQRLSDFIIPSRYRGPHEDGLQNFRRTGEGAVLNKRIEITALHRTGREFPVELAITPILMGTSVIFSAFIRDITERQRSQQELRVAKEAAELASRAKSQFLANMSHELRTPLNSVIGFAGILLKNKDNALSAQHLNFLNRILANGRHLLDLINEVLDLSKIEAGKMEIEHSSTDVAALVRDTLAQLEGRLAGRDLYLRADLPEDPAPVDADAGKLKQVLINLVGNALKFTEQGGVTVRVHADGASRRPYRIDVIDTGIGIPKERQSAIFDAFQQADNTTSRKYGGTGLGLTITRSLCGLMGYAIAVESDPGRGSTFTVLMGKGTPAPPRKETTAIVARARSADAPAPPSETGRRVVLIIDDEADSRTLVTEYVREAGCAVLTADSGRRGLDLAEKHRPDLITLDLLMPDMPGWEVLRLLKASPTLRSIPVLIVSIIAGESRGALLGSIDSVAKPFAREEILDALRRNMSGERGRVLIVDDDEDARRILVEHLSEEKLEIATAGDGRAALQVLETFAADLIILDLLMPVMDGTEFLEHLRRNPRFVRVPVIVVTAKELTEEALRQLALQSAGVLKKGGSLEQDVKRSLHDLLGRPVPGT